MSKRLRIVASFCGLGFFLLVVAVQSLLEPSYDLLRQQISEFAHTSDGPLLLAGFLVWGASLLLLAGLITHAPTRRGAILVEVVALLSAAFGLLLITCFATDRGVEVAGTVTDRTVTGRIHDASSAVISVSILVAVVADAFRERSAGLACIVISVAVTSSAVLFSLGDPLPGLRQRCLVGCACLWQAVVLWRLWRLSPTLV
ncbi:MAG TPA: DUF998 domain-containing protein [Solirubrobacterales bacterium]|nr:DUF998 domain-containing protein [Solirubrobacterales bacterium]